MKILFLNNFYYLRGGSERVLFGEMDMLRKAGHEVAVFSRTNPCNVPSAYAGYFPAAIDTDRLVMNLQAFSTVKELIYSHAARRGLRRVIEEFKPDIVHAHNIYGRLSLSVLDELKAAGVPVVMTLHDLKLLCPSYLMLNRGAVCEKCKGGRYYRAFLSCCHKGSYPASLVYALESWVNDRFGKYRTVSRFVTPSRFLREKCIEYGWNSELVSYLPNSVDAAAPGSNRQPGEYLLYLGRLSSEKGVSTLITASSRAKKPLPLLIVGDGPQREALERQSAVLGVPARFTGHLQGGELREALYGARALVIPSEWFENAPMSLLELFAAAKPVLGSRIGGIPEMIDEGVNGFMFEPGDPGSLAQTLARFSALSDGEVAAMGEAACAKAGREFSPARHVGALLELYGEVLAQSPRK